MKFMYFNVFATVNCNLHCRYCGYREKNNQLPEFPNYSVVDLKKFLEMDPNVVVTFYGGEPLLNIKFIEKVMDNIKVKDFMLQTNGLLLHKLRIDLLKKLHTILLSIDGNEQVTDYYRGIGTYKKAVENAMLARNKGFNGELIARMTIFEKTDIYKQVNNIIQLEDSPFDAVHWQLNVEFAEIDKWNDVKSWIEDSYNPGVVKLIEEWFEEMKKGNVRKIYPFVGVMRSLLLDQPTKMRCGAGWCFDNILTDGKIAPCTDMTNFPEYILGDIRLTNPLELKDKLTVKEPCTECGIYKWCGGRCLRANLLKPWGEEGFELICSTVENLINKLIKILPDVKKMIHAGKLTIDDFSYTKYNGCEVIPRKE